MFKYIRKYKHKKGFTLIELIVVIAVIAVLVLLAAPNFIGKTNDAKLAQIQNDVRVVEGKLAELLVKKPETYEEWTTVEEEVLQDFIKSEHLFGIGGPVLELELEPGPYKEVSENFVDDINTQLDGDFYANEKGRVYYKHDKILGKTNNKTGNNNKSGNGRNDFANYNEEHNPSLAGNTSGLTDYENDNEEVVLYGLKEEALDGDLTTYQSGKPGIVTWDGNLTHREITITGRGHDDYGIYASSLHVRFLDDKGNIIPEGATGNNNLRVAGPSTDNTIKAVVPKGATKMELYPSKADFYRKMRIYEVSVPDTNDRPNNATISSKTGLSSIEMYWSGASRVIIKRKNGKPIEVNGDSIKLSPESDTDGEYKVLVLDKNGNGQEYKHVIKSDNLMLYTSDYDRNVFDGDSETYSTGRGVINLNERAAHREITITGRGHDDYGIYASSLHVKFLDDKGNIIPEEATGNSNLRVAGPSTVSTIKAVVPKGATKMELYPSKADFYRKMRIYEISTPDVITRPTNVNINSVVETGLVKFDWDTVNRAIIRKDNHPPIDVTGNSVVLPPRSFTNGEYSLVVFDKHGNGQKVTHTIDTTSLVAVTNDIGVSAFDGDKSTAFRGYGFIELDSAVIGREIEITGAGYRPNSGAYVYLRVRFLNELGEPIPAEGSSSSYTQISNSSSSINTVKLTVPEGAKRLEFYNGHEYGSKPSDSKIYEIRVLK